MRGGATCTGCHIEAHITDIEVNEQLQPQNNALCTRCHEAIGEDLTAHTFHAADSGRQLVRRVPHAPVGHEHSRPDAGPQHLDPVAGEHDPLRDPERLQRLPRGRGPAWADARMDERWGDTPRRRKIERRASAYTGARRLDREALDALLTMSAEDAEGPVNRANASGHLGRYLADAATRERATARAGSRHRRRARARARGGRPETRRVGGPRREGGARHARRPVQDEKRIVRMNAAISLLNLGVRDLPGEPGERFELAKRRHAIRGAFFADDAPQQLNLGRLHVLDGNPGAAERAFEQSYHLDPDQPGIRFFMAVTRLSQQRLEEARELLRSVPDGDPFAAEAQNLLSRLAR